MENKWQRLLCRINKVELPENILHRTEPIILHVGDIPIWGYAYMKKLIRQIHPDILVHTGDLVDNLKVGRIPTDVPAYKKHAKVLLSWMLTYSDQLYLVPGNNDLEDFMRKAAPNATLVKPDTVVEFYGIPFTLCHRVLDITKDSAFYLYGHGPTGDTHKWEDNGKNGKYYSNAYKAPCVIFPKQKRLYRLKNYNGGITKP